MKPLPGLHPYKLIPEPDGITDTGVATADTWQCTVGAQPSKANKKRKALPFHRALVCSFTVLTAQSSTRNLLCLVPSPRILGVLNLMYVHVFPGVLSSS